MALDDSSYDRPQDKLTAEGIKLPNFRMLRELGRGGMGVVFLASQISLEREVAVKVFPAQGVKDTNLKRFFREVQLCVSLSHPNVVKLLDAGSTDEWAWLAMECINGQPLDRYVHTHGAMKASQLAIAMEELADALDFVHEHKIVHRDIKPANVMKPNTGGLKLMDFGLARMDSSVTLTDQGAVVGSPRYLAPETVTGGVMDTVTDLYSLGFLFYEIATATRPYDSRSLRETLAGIVREVLPPPSRHEPSLPPEIDRILLKLLAKSREERYQTTAELLVDVRQLRASADFVGTSWETSRPNLDLLGSAADLITGAQAPTPNPTAADSMRIKMNARSTKSTPVRRPTGSFAAAPRSATLSGPPSTVRVLAIAAVIGALIGFATIALVHARRTTIKQVAASPTSPASQPASGSPPPEPVASTHLLGLVEPLVAAVEHLEPLVIVQRMQAEIGNRPGNNKIAQLPGWNQKARNWLSEQSFADRWRKLTSRVNVSTLLEDPAVPLRLRRQVYNSALLFQHLDDFITPDEVDPPFRAAQLLKPWLTNLEAPGSTIAAGVALCQELPPGGTCRNFLHHEIDPDKWYWFYDQKDNPAASTPIHEIGGSDTPRFEDAQLPVVAIEGAAANVTVWGLTNYLFAFRWIQLDFRPLDSADKDPQVRTLIFRPGARYRQPLGVALSPEPQGCVLSGARTSGDLLPVGRYEVRVRSFRSCGQEPFGMWVKELWLQTTP